MPIVYLGIGSNLGSRQDNCLRAVELLEPGGVKPLARSSLYETAPWGNRSQPMFINMAVRAETALSPPDLLLFLKKIENYMGRVPSDKWGPRIIDLDILLYDDLVLQTADLVIPHPLMHERAFVLEPLAEIAPDLVHPVMQKKIRKLADNIKNMSSKI